MAITITRTIDENPAVYGVPVGETTPAPVAVQFGYGTLTNVLAKIGTADDGVIYFGYDDTNSTGAIVSRGKLVSSKILDIKTTAAVTGKGGSVSKEAQIVISYIDIDKTVKTLEIPVSASAQLKSLADRLTAVETLVGKKTDTKDKETVFGAIAKEADRATTKEIAISDLLGTKDDDKTKETAFGKIATEVARATDAETGLSTRIKTLEDKKYTTVTPKADGHVKVTVNTNNVVTVTENDIASAKLLGTLTDGSTAKTAFGKIAAEADRATKAEGGLNTRVTSIETLITSDKDGTINKVSEVIDWFKGVSEGEGGAKLLSDVAANKTAIGTEKTTDKPGTGIYKRIEDLEAKKHVKSDVTATTGKYVSGVKVDETGALTIKETALTAAGVAATPITAGDTTVAVTGANVSAQITSLATSIKSASASANSTITDAINKLDVADTAVAGQYVSAVSETDGKIKVTRANLPKLSVKTGSEQFVGVDNHAVEIKTTPLNTVGLTKTEAGKWQAGTADAKSTGLASAADVAAEIVSDEQVIATALNDHETRLHTVETKAITVTSAKSNVAISGTDFNVTNGKITFTIHNGGEAVAETITAYTEETVKALIGLYTKEKDRASKAEAELNKKLTWINV